MDLNHVDAVPAYKFRYIGDLARQRVASARDAVGSSVSKKNQQFDAQKRLFQFALKLSEGITPHA
jgi:hypothetical protein